MCGKVRLQTQASWTSKPWLYARVSHSWHCRHLGLDNSLLEVGGGCPVHCKMFNNIRDCYPLEASSTRPQMWQPKLSLDVAKCFLGAKLLPVENSCSWLTGAGLGTQARRIERKVLWSHFKSLRAVVLSSVILKLAPVHSEVLTAACWNEPRTAAGPFIWGLTWHALTQQATSHQCLSCPGLNLSGGC